MKKEEQQKNGASKQNLLSLLPHLPVIVLFHALTTSPYLHFRTYTPTTHRECGILSPSMAAAAEEEEGAAVVGRGRRTHTGRREEVDLRTCSIDASAGTGPA